MSYQVRLSPPARLFFLASIAPALSAAQERFEPLDPALRIALPCSSTQIMPGPGSGLRDDGRDSPEHGGDPNVATAVETACAQLAGGNHRRWPTFEPPLQA